MTCVVPGGVRRGWSVVTRAAGGLEAAIHLAHTRAARRCEGQGEVAGGGAHANRSRSCLSLILTSEWLIMMYRCTCARSPHPPPWPCHSFPSYLNCQHR